MSEESEKATAPEENLWIRFDFHGKSISGKTDIWGVVADQSNITLGTIRWYGPWRCYAFGPYLNALFEKDCLRAIANFCEEQTKMHKEKLHG